MILPTSRRTLELLLAFLLLAGPPTDARGQEVPPPITIGERFSLDSEVLGEERPYWVYRPASYDQARFAPRSYPVLYLLDGSSHFHSATGVVQFMSEGINGNLQIPEMIVVAIPNTDRTRDLTPTHSTTDYPGDEAPALASSGGGDAFLRFIAEELVPEIESTYRTQPYRILVGHSFGGLFALHALLEKPGLFQSYIAIDPSLWWDDQVLVERARGRLDGAVEGPGSVYITLANNPPIRGTSSEGMAQAGRDFAAVLEGVSTPRFRTDLRYFESEDHGSVPLISLYHGLLHAFEGYKPSVASVLDNPSSIEDSFAAVSDRLGIDLPPPEPFVNRLGYLMIAQMDDVENAIELFRINVANYPTSYNAYDSLGEAYMIKGDTAVAIENYERSLELNPENENARERLRELGAGG